MATKDRTTKKTASQRSDRSAETRERLIATARELFWKDGYASVSAEEISEQAGVTRGALHHHFGDKQGLFRLIVERSAYETAESIYFAVVNESDPLKRIRKGIEHILGLVTSTDLGSTLLMQGPAVLGWELCRHIEYRYGMQILLGNLQGAVRDGVLPKQDIESFAVLITGAVHEAALTILHSDDQERTKQRLVEALDKVFTQFVASARENEATSKRSD